MKKKISKHVKKNEQFRWMHWLILFVSIILTLSAWYIADRQAENRRVNRFNQQSMQVTHLIKERMQKYENALLSAIAHIKNLNKNINRKRWASYANVLKIDKRYPGINGIGVIYKINRKDREDYEKQQQSDHPGFKIYPEHNKKILIPITYIEPIAINKAAVGLDMAHEKNRYTAAIKSEKTGKPTITGPIVLVQDDEKTPGFLFFVPMYDVKNSANKEFLGWVYAPFIVKKLVHGILGEENRQLSIKINDGKTILYQDKQEKGVKSNKELFSNGKVIKQVMYGRTWTYTIVPTKVFEEANKTSGPLVILIAGIVIDLMLFYIFFMFSQQNKKMNDYAESVTRDLEKKSKALSRLAMFDKLTNLPNRDRFLDHLTLLIKHHKKKTEKILVMLINIDNFQRINDMLTHSIGDKALCAFTDRLKEKFSCENAFLSRLGGDDFGIIVNSVKSMEQVPVILEGCINIFKPPFVIDNNEIFISITIGAALYPDHSHEASSLIVNSDVAMFYAKKQGKKTYYIYDEKINDKIVRQHTLSFSLNNALEKNEFHLLYQPQVEIKSRKVIGFEALIRWENEKLGSVSPAEFIPLLEESKQIIKVGRWVVEQTFKDFDKLQKNRNHSSLKISINTSTVELQDESYAEYLKEKMKQFNVKGEDIYIEITESILLNNAEKALAILGEIKASSIQCALDDYGTGYSSMKYLKDMPVSLIKIDQSFIKNLATSEENRAIVRSTIALCHELGMEVLAEGVENKTQFELLLEFGCEYAQGFYFYKPMTFSSIAKLLEK